MVSIVENEAVRARIIQAGQKRALEFSDSERMTREYWELFKYAVSKRPQYQNLLIGVFADAWVGPSLSVQVAAAKTPQTLEIEFGAPEWLPQGSMTVQVSREGKPQGIPFVFQGGTKAILSIPVEATGGGFNFNISPTFVPAHFGYSDDSRELSVQIRKCRINYADSGSVQLFPEMINA
jgi:hypothetical protein